MTDKKPEIPPGSQAPAASVAATPGPSTTATPAPKKTSTAPRSRPVLLPAFIIVLLLALALAGALWYQQQAFKQTRSDLFGQVQSSTSAANQAAEQAQQALSRVQEQSRQISTLEATLRDSVDHLDSLEQAFQTLTDRGSDLVLINDVDHLVTIAQQQLQLSGNVANAIISLETAQAQLARANRPGLASLQQAINGDLDRLRAASTVDVALMSSQLEELSALVSEAPLMVPDDAAPEPVLEAPAAGGPPRVSTNASGNAAEGDAPWWKQGFQTAEDWSRKAWEAIRQDLGQFITVRRADDPTALLMSPDQASRFRDNLRLRVMTAQLALMMRQPGVWTSETTALVKALESRYDPKSPQTRQALKLARQMADTSIATKLPTVTNSLQAIESLREASTKEAGGGAADAPAEAPAEPSSTEPAAPATKPATPPQPVVPSADPASSDQPAHDGRPEASPAQGAAPEVEKPAPQPEAAPDQPAPTTLQG